MQLKKEGLDYYVRRLRELDFFSLSRYGDGEWLCIFGKAGGNSNGCAYTPELQHDLIQSLMHKDPNFLYGMQRILPSQLLQADNYLRRHHFPIDNWFDTEIFADSLQTGDLFPLIKVLRQMPVIMIANEEWKWSNQLFEPKLWIKVPRANAHAHKDRVIREVMAYGKPAVYLFSCGMAACSFVSELHGKIKDSFFIDIGHIWDPFSGLKSRDYLATLSDEIINQNLHAKTE